MHPAALLFKERKPQTGTAAKLHRLGQRGEGMTVKKLLSLPVIVLKLDNYKVELTGDLRSCLLCQPRCRSD